MDYLPVPRLAASEAAAASRTSINPHTRFFHSFRHPLFIRHHHPITSISFSPTKPHRFAISSSSRVVLYAPKTGKVTKTITRFKENARGVDIRQDGKLLVSGGDDGLVQVFDLSSRAILRTMKGHEQPVHCTRFSPSKTEILSASDDGTVRLWDLPSQTPIHTFAGHSDYVRTCAFLPSNPSLVLSGSYDGTVKLWDARVGGGESGDSQLTMGRPGAGAMPVEALLAFPDGSAGGSGGLCLSAGGPILRLWDLAMAGRCVRALSNHQKTITCMSFDSNRRRVLTGGLDQLVKVYDVEDWSVVHTMRYPAPLLSLALSPDDTHIAAGMTDGTLSVRRRDPKASEVAAEETERAALSTGAYEYFADFEQVFGRGHVKTKGAKVEVPVAPIEESRVETLRRKKLKDYDKYLKKFRYGQALDAVTAKKTVRPATAFALIQELIYRDGLRIALAGRDDVTLQPVLDFLSRHVCDPRFGSMAADVLEVVMDMYSSVLGQAPLIDDLLRRTQRKVQHELDFQRQLVSLTGALEMVLAQAALSRTT